MTEPGTTSAPDDVLEPTGRAHPDRREHATGAPHVAGEPARRTQHERVARDRD